MKANYSLGVENLSKPQIKTIDIVEYKYHEEDVSSDPLSSNLIS